VIYNGRAQDVIAGDLIEAAPKSTHKFKNEQELDALVVLGVFRKD
jgi:hypothetical protein